MKKSRYGYARRMVKILIVEDDELLLDALGGQLRQLGYAVLTAGSVTEALALLEQEKVDGIVLDIGLPGASGLDLLVDVRARMAGLPVMILTARDGIEDRVLGLNCGADDYMTKPFNMAELQARLQSMLRRAQLPAYRLANEAAAGQGAHLGPLRIDYLDKRAFLFGDDMELTQREWELLDLLAGRSGEVVTREDVMAAWRADVPESPAATQATNALEVYVHRLRKKLQHSGLNIRNIRGLGYMLQNPAPGAP